MPMRISYEKLIVDSKEFALSLPKDINYIVGVPRDGMLVATIIACQLDLPLSMFNDGHYINSELLGSVGFPSIGKFPQWKEIEKPVILFVDDYYKTGESIRKVRGYRNHNKFNSKDIYATLYYDKDCNRNGFDIGFLEVEKPIFEWSL